jgi:hypothetical protein
MLRVFDTIFSRDWDAIATYCADDPSWGRVVDVLALGGWELLTALLEVDTFSADDTRVETAAKRWLEAVV